MFTTILEFVHHPRPLYQNNDLEMSSVSIFMWTECEYCNFVQPLGSFIREQIHELCAEQSEYLHIL